MHSAEYNDLKPMFVKAGPQLAVLLDTQATPYQPGGTVSGVISRHEPLFSSRGAIMISLVGRSGLIYTNISRNGKTSTTTRYRSKIILFTESRKVHDGPIRVTNLEPQTWPFSIPIPTHASPVTGNFQTKSPGRSFLSLDPENIAGTPLPATFKYHSGASDDEIDAWVEYYLEATLVEEHGETNIPTGLTKPPPEIRHARLPLVINPPAFPPLFDFKILQHTILNQTIQTQRLLPGREGDRLSPREHLSKLFHTSSVPKFGFSVQLDFPTVLQLGNTIPLGIRVIPTQSLTSRNIRGVHQTVKILSFKLRVIARLDIKVDLESSEEKEGYVKDMKAYFEVDYTKEPWNEMVVVIPSLWGASEFGPGSGRTSRDAIRDEKGFETSAPAFEEGEDEEDGEPESWSKQLEGARTTESKREEAGLEKEVEVTVDTTQQPHPRTISQPQPIPQPPSYGSAKSSTLDLGATMNLRLEKDHILCQGQDRQQWKKMVLGANFTTFNMSLDHLLKLEVTLEIAGEKVKVSEEQGVTLVPGWS